MGAVSESNENSPGKGPLIVTTCLSGVRAKKAADIVASLGYNVAVYPGSFNDWKSRGGKVNIFHILFSPPNKLPSNIYVAVTLQLFVIQ